MFALTSIDISYFVRFVSFFGNAKRSVLRTYSNRFGIMWQCVCVWAPRRRSWSWVGLALVCFACKTHFPLTPLVHTCVVHFIQTFAASLLYVLHKNTSITVPFSLSANTNYSHRLLFYFFSPYLIVFLQIFNTSRQLVYVALWYRDSLLQLLLHSRKSTMVTSLFTRASIELIRMQLTSVNHSQRSECNSTIDKMCWKGYILLEPQICCLVFHYFLKWYCKKVQKKWLLIVAVGKIPNSSKIWLLI